MTSGERHIERYWRRKRARRARSYKNAEQFSNIYKVFCYRNLAKAFNKALKGVRWKPSVRKFASKSFINLKKEQTKVYVGGWKGYSLHRFDIMERGKLRHIQSVQFSEKVIQRCFCDECLIPVIEPHLIYDNAATVKGKGTEFLIKRLVSQLKHAYNKYGKDCLIWFFDFHDYFNTIVHKLLKDKVSLVLFVKRLLILLFKLIDKFPGEAGLGLGSQISQILAVYYPNEIDHLIKDKFRINGYGRYNDDGYAICNDLSILKKLIREVNRLVNYLGLTFNSKKCKIIRINQHFIFLKKRIHVTESGAVIVRISRKSITNERKRLRKFKGFIEQGKMTFEEVKLSFHSWLCQVAKCNGYHIVKNTIKYFNELFIEYGKYEARKPKHGYQNKRYRLIAFAVKQLSYGFSD